MKDRTKNLLVFFAFLGATLIFFFSQEPSGFRRFSLSDFKLGRPAPEDVILDRDIVYTDEEATSIKREAETQLASAVFEFQSQISRRTLEQYYLLSNNFPSSNLNPRALFLRFQTFLPGKFTLDQWEILSGYGGEIIEIIKAGENLLTGFLSEGVFESGALGPDTEITGVDLRYPEGKPEFRHLEAPDILTLDNYPQKIQEMIERGSLAPDWLIPLNVLMGAFLTVNVTFDRENTEKYRQAARDKVQPVTRIMVAGERIIQEGSIINAEDLKKLKILGNYNLTTGNSAFVGSLLFFVLLFFTTLIFFSSPLTSPSPERSQVVLIIALFLIYYTVYMLLVRLSGTASVFPLSAFLPVAAITMILTILTKPQIGLFTGILFALGHFFQIRMEPYAFLFVLFSGFIGTIAVVDTRKKGYLIRATVIVALFNAALLLTLAFLRGLTFTQSLGMFALGLGNGLASGVLATGFLPFIEHIFNTATPNRLMEISDLNNSLFRRMLLQAPGTYSHSLAVANLAEAAALAIGADALLVRAGALYHDIGKLEQPEYFVENQTAVNKHDYLKASLSASIIKSHLKLGIEKCRELGLPQKVIDIVAQHHGSGLISYFYIQALKEQEKKSQSKKVNPEDFSYSGVPPQTREAAIVMLADSIEAATRTLEKPSIAKLEKFIWDIIMGKVNAEQMKNCDLTFRDLEVIKDNFVRILAGQYHSRIEYPDLKKTLTDLENKKEEAAKAGKSAGKE
jgi:putative nucleotidyltransferase with HDIG domain